MMTNDKPVTVTLSPCPFCGSPSALKCIPLDERFGYAARYEAQCTNCPAKISATDNQNPKGGYALSTGAAEATTAWNARTAHAPSQHSELADRLAINTIVASLLAPLEPDFPERIRIGNESCTAILSALRQNPAERRDAWEAAQKCRRHGSNSGVYAISDQDCTCGITAAIRALATEDADDSHDPFKHEGYDDDL